MYNILLIDDEIIVREALKVILKDMENVEVVGEAASVEEALALIESNSPDMTFLDIKIPGTDIVYLIKFMKRLKPKNKVILLTDYGSSDFVFKALEMGADGYLLKPYPQKDIYKIVNLYLSQVSSHTENLEQIIEPFIDYIYKEDFKNSKEQLKAITEQLTLVCANNSHALCPVTDSIIKGLGTICREKQLLFSKRLEWKEKIQHINANTFESTMLCILEDIFKTMKDTESIKEIKVIQSVLNYIEKNFQKGVTLEEAAEFVHLSPFYLSKLFKKELKINFVNYVTERKIQKAKDLLESTDMPVLNIALELNYQEANYFSKVFKKIVGVTPTDYRKEKKDNPNSTAHLLKRNNYIPNGNWYV
ncbi:response regulator [Schinkia azotoformans]|uniref:response regulator n=1 Tax=Schinkia azotoformans TaxID=1454 RepID=UPI002DB61678|nr:response regulator [Schinkia azotoformans]MEC1714872.1 response regulator [Schinkia azotoformans]MEC1743389.1 response regulator [Schinkia azotoformans]MEC1746809.1 response regulator [Schinkia azotoformans]MEC1760084.1 response regulator [Schinkia azotoformans]MEC1768604.1 response regulator [Schinkia azotoformans]